MTTLNMTILLKFIFSLSFLFPMLIASYFFRFMRTKNLIPVRTH